MLFQFNKYYNISLNANSSDAHGIQFDGDVSNSTMQYNYTHNNDGSGYALSDNGDSAPEYALYARHANNIIRYNISENNRRKVNDLKQNLTQGSFCAWSGAGADLGWQNLLVYNNTFYNNLAPAAITPSILLAFTGPSKNARFYNNIFMTADGQPQIMIDNPQ